MFKQTIGSTFSDIWYRVERSRPKLSPHAQIIRQHFGPQTAFVVEEPASGQFFRLTHSAYIFVAMLDGSRTVGEAWDACNAQLGDNAPTQRECINALAQLQMAGLLLGETPLAPDAVLERKRLTRKRRFDRRAGRMLFYNVPLVNPERWLERHAALWRFLFSKIGLILWLALAGTALALVVAHWNRFESRLVDAAFFDPANLALLAAIFLVLRAIHEFGHAAACKAFGGRVTEIGVILIAGLLPLPYCDASAAWRFPRTRHRVVVSLGGILVEMTVAAVAAILWAVLDPVRVPLLSALCHNIAVVASVTTLIFNLNPLLRYDGYYILSDLAGSPNLAQRSNQLWKAGFLRYAFGIRSPELPYVRDRGELALLTIYNALSFPYRMLVLLAIFLLVVVRYPTVGIILGVAILAVSAVWPIMSGLGFLISHASLEGRRTRAFAVVGSGLATVLLFLGLVPMPASTYAPGVIAPAMNAPLRTGEDGFLRKVLASPGQRVRTGQPVLELENPMTLAELRIAEARVASAEATLAKAIALGPAERKVAESQLETALAELTRARDRAASLTVTAPADGVIVAGAPDRLQFEHDLGRFFTRGALIGTVASTDDLVVRVSLPDRKAAPLYLALQNADASIKVHGATHETIPAAIIRTVDAGTRDLPDRALSASAGGGIVTDPEDDSGRRTLEPQFIIELRPERLPEGVQPGLRARARFSLPPEPLLAQWVRHARQYFRDRLG